MGFTKYDLGRGSWAGRGTIKSRQGSPEFPWFGTNIVKVDTHNRVFFSGILYRAPGVLYREPLFAGT